MQVRQIGSSNMGKWLTLEELIESGETLDTRTGETICPVTANHGYHMWWYWTEVGSGEERYTCAKCQLRVYETGAGTLYR